MAKNNPQRVERELKKKIAREIAEVVYTKVLEQSYMACSPYDMLHLLYTIECELNIAPPPKEDKEAVNEDTSY